MKAEFLKMEKATAGNSIEVKFHYGVVCRGHVVPFEIHSDHKPLSKKDQLLAHRISATFAVCMNSLWFPHDPRFIRSAHLEGVNKIALQITYRDGDKRTTEWHCKLSDDYFFNDDLGLYAMIEDDQPTFEVDLTFER